MNEERSKWPLWFTGALLIVLFVAVGGAWTMIEWTVNRIYVPEGHSLLLRYKGPPLPFLPGSRPVATPGEFAQVDEGGNPQQIGVLQQMKGPGRHFLWYGWWQTELVEDTVIAPGEVAIVTSKMGKDLPAGQYLVDGNLDETEFKGILRGVLGPGRYRINPYAYDVKPIKLETISRGAQQKVAGWVEIPSGYVGVVTNLTANPATGAQPGISEDVLPPGLYPVNPKEQHVDIVKIGFREKSIKAELMTDNQGRITMDKSGEPMVANDETGITFPSNDGFSIVMDFTAVWGITPEQAPEVIRKFGNVEAVETKVVVPQIESICRNMGSKLGAVDLLVGESRQQFQESTSKAFQDVLSDKGLTLLYGLVRHIYIPQEVRVPIQQSFIADELKLTREQEQLTAKTEANLREAEQKVLLETERITVETEKLVAQALAEGEKEAEETRAETTKLVASIDRQTAELEAQATVLRGEAEANVEKFAAEAKAEKFKLAVQAFGSGQAYNQWVFASGLPDDLELKLLYAGEGTFWTDLKGFTDVMLGKQIQQQQPERQTIPATRRR
ncbi:SPFH domain-containing protein [Maioricimonas rarisocia]|nr:SPFH domain-containing protein [Maioricimonas rarisocia]